MPRKRVLVWLKVFSIFFFFLQLEQYVSKSKYFFSIVVW